MQILSHFRRAERPPARSNQSSRATNDAEEHGHAREEPLTRTSTTASKRTSPRWWRIYWFRGMWRDIKRRAPYYGSDFVDAWDYRVLPATVYMYFAKYAFPK